MTDSVTGGGEKQAGKTLLFYFSATGNSLVAARTLAAGIGNAELRPMTSAPLAAADINDCGKVGFVCPVFYGKLPRLVQSFIEQFPARPDAYYFAILTSGGPGHICWGAMTVVDALLRGRGAALSFGKVIQYAGNCVIKYDVPMTERIQAQLQKAAQSTGAAAEAIRAGERNPVRWPKFSLNTLYRDIPALDDAFRADDRCVGCGICQRVCPVRNIQLAEGRPFWQHHCERCLACIHWCPNTAIQYADKTSGRQRYHHPEVSLGDIETGRGS